MVKNEDQLKENFDRIEKDKNLMNEKELQSENKIEENQNEIESVSSEDFTSENLEEKQSEEVETSTEKGEEELTEMEKIKIENEQLKNEVNEWKEKFIRKMADFDNYRKRAEVEKAQAFQLGIESVIKNLLTILDDFERTLNYSKEELNQNPVLQGVEMVYKKLFKILEDYGLKRIDSLFQPFNHDLHEALIAVERNDVEPMTVVEEVEKGYLLKDKVIRHSKVIVSKEVSLEEKDSSNNENNEEGR